MKIHEIQVCNYRSAGEKCVLRFATNILALIGKNESGKSNILEALSNVAVYTDMDNNAFPWSAHNRFTSDDSPMKIVLRMELEDCDLSELQMDGGAPENERQMEIVISRTSRGLTQTIDGLFSSYIKRWSDIAENQECIQEVLSFAKKQQMGPIAEYTRFIKALSSYRSVYIPEHERILKWGIDSILPRLSDKETRECFDCVLLRLSESLTEIYARFRKVVPSFFKFDDSRELHNQYRLQDIGRDGVPPRIDLVGLDRWLRAIRLNREQLRKTLEENDLSRRNSMINYMQEKTKEILDEFNRQYWNGTENIHLKPQVDDQTISFSISSGGTYESLLWSERSAGLRWYLSAFFEIKGREATRNAVFMIDEPGVHLHVNAQKEVLALFDALARDSHYLIYTTHSPYMIDTNRLENVRAVCKEGDVTAIFEPHNIKKESSWMETLTPLCEAFGFSLRENLGPVSGKTNLLVEGITDRMYLFAMMKCLDVGFEKEIVIIPCCGAGTVHNVFSILYGWGFPTIALVDNDPAGIREEEIIAEWIGSDADNPAITLRVTDTYGGSIECLISDSDYFRFFSEEKTLENIKRRETKKEKACLFFRNVNSREWIPDETTKQNFRCLFAKINAARHQTNTRA